MEDRASQTMHGRGGIDTVGGETHVFALACSACSALHYPNPRFCYRCHSTQFERVDAGAEGTLYSFSQVHVAPARFNPPYAVGYVDLPIGLRVFAQMAGDEAFELGGPVVLDPRSEGWDDETGGVPKLVFRRAEAVQ